MPLTETGVETTVRSKENGENFTTAKMDGNIDKMGIPDPFYMDLHFTVEANRIAVLDFRLAGDWPTWT
jgi:hypothetical protein